MIRLTDVVRHLLVINVIIFFAANIMWNGAGMLAMHYPTTDQSQPYQIITHMFAHGSLLHIAFNMISLAVFGPAIEALWGERRFLFYYLFAGFGSLGLDLLVQFYTGEQHSMLGASGAIVGVAIAYAYNYPNNKIGLIFPPIILPAKYMVVLFLGFDLVMGLTGSNDGIAHFAHLGGALAGFILLLYWRKFGSRF